jgi:hypothetical protein
MASQLEQILCALEDALTVQCRADVLRNSPVPQKLQGEGLVVLHDGDPGDPEVTLSPLRYHYQHEAEINLFASGRKRQDKFERLKAAIANALKADRTFGGLCDWAEAGAPEAADLATEGGEMKAATIPIRLHFATDDPLT